MKAKKHISLALRMAAGIALLVLLLSWVGLDTLRASVSDFHAGHYVVAVALLLLHFLFQSAVLRHLLAAKAVTVRTLHVFRVMLIANFFGVFLPGGMGPDMVLCYNMARSTERKEVGLSAVLFSRITVLFLMALLAFVVSFHPLAAGTGMTWITGGALAVFLLYAFIMANQNSVALARRLLDFLNRHRWTALLYRVYFVLAEFGQDRRTMARILPYVVGSAVIKIVADYVIACALGYDIPLLYFFIFIPIVTIVSAVPLTFAGLGVREGSFVGLFTLAGIPAEQALAVSLCSFTLVLVIAVIGAVLYAGWGSGLVTHVPTPPGDQD